MQFYIHTIRVNSIASIGSLNIGNTILSSNRSTVVTQTGAETGESEEEGTVLNSGTSVGPGAEAEADDIFGGSPPVWRNGQ